MVGVITIMGDVQHTAAAFECEKRSLPVPQPVLGAKIKSGSGLLAALEAITNCDFVRNGVLIVLSPGASGRIGVFGNRYLTGGAQSSSGTSGIAAIVNLLAVKTGMYVFRPCLQEEIAELGQSISVDIWQILALSREDEDSSTAPQRLNVYPTDTFRCDTYLADVAETEVDSQCISTQKQDSAKQTGHNGLSGINSSVPSDLPEPKTDETTASVANSEASASQRWLGLDDIPTPANIHQVDPIGPVTSALVRRSAEDVVVACEDLLTSKAISVDPKLFIKQRSSEQYTPRYSWLNHPVVLCGLSAFLLTAVGWFGYLKLVGADVDHCLKQGYRQLMGRNFKAAVVNFGKAIDKDPKNAQAYYYRAIAFAEAGDVEKSENDLLHAASCGMAKLNVQLARASIEVRRGNWNEAIALLSELVVSEPPNVEVFRLRATCYAHLSDYANARADLSRALTLCNNETEREEIKADRGRIELQMNRLEDAVADFADSLRVKPSAAVYMLCGDAFRKNKLYQESMQDYNQVLGLEPGNADAFVGRGICRTSLGQDDGALEDFSRAIQLKKDSVVALINRGSIYLAHGAYQLAIDDFKAAYAINPTIPETYAKLNDAESLLAKSEPVKAKPKEVNGPNLPHHPPRIDPDKVGQIGYQYLNDGHYAEAVSYLTEAVHHAPNDASARTYLARALTGAGQTAAAVAQFKALARLQPLVDDDLLMYAKDLELNGETVTAIELLRDRVNAKPQFIEARLEQANIYFRAGLRNYGEEVCHQGLKFATKNADKALFEQLLAHPPEATTRK